MQKNFTLSVLNIIQPKYDGLCGHLAIVMMTYDLLAWQERQKKMNVLSETCSISWAKQCLI